MVLLSRAGPADFGWTAYEPLSESSDWYMGWTDGSAVFLSRGQLAGGAAMALGLMVITAGIGFQLGRRR